MSVSIGHGALSNLIHGCFLQRLSVKYWKQGIQICKKLLVKLFLQGMLFQLYIT